MHARASKEYDIGMKVGTLDHTQILATYTYICIHSLICCTILHQHPHNKATKATRVTSSNTAPLELSELPLQPAATQVHT